MNKDQYSDINRPNEIEKNENIDLVLIYNLIKRNSKIFLIINLIFGSLSLLICNFVTPKWKGEFDIVLSDNSTQTANLSNLSNLSSANISRLLKGKIQSEDTETKVEILKSASVLMPIFEEVKNYKKDRGIDTSNWRFASWQKDNLITNIKENTKVFNIVYLDEDKDLVIPTLDKITNIYKSYLIKEKKRTINNALNFINAAIDEYKIKSQDSLKAEKEFATKYKIDPANYQANLTTLSNTETSLLKINNQSKSSFGDNLISLENEIERLTKYIEKVEAEDDAYAYHSIRINADNDNEVLNNPFVLEIDKINKELIILSTYFKANDSKIIDLKNRKKEFMKQNKLSLIENLETQKKIKQINYENLKKPDQLLVEYRLLIDETLRNDLALKQLEIEKMSLSLENKKSQDGWKLITNPTLFPNPIKPSKKLALFYGLLLGSSFALIFSKLKENRDDKIYDYEYITSQSMKYEYLLDMSTNGISIDQFKKTLIGKINGEKNKTISIIKEENVNNIYLNSIISNFKNNVPKLENPINKNINNINNKQIIILLFELGKSKKSNFKSIKNFLVLNEINTNYILLYNN